MDNHTKQTDPSVEYLIQMFPEEFLRDLARISRHNLHNNPPHPYSSARTYPRTDAQPIYARLIAKSPKSIMFEEQRAECKLDRTTERDTHDEPRHPQYECQRCYA